MDDIRNDRCTVYTKLTNFEHKQLLEMVSHSGRPITQIIRDAVNREIDLYQQEHQLPVNPIVYIAKLRSEMNEKKAASKSLKALKESGLFDNLILKELEDQAGLLECKTEEPENVTNRTMCRAFLKGLLFGREMRVTDILDCGISNGFSNRQVQRSLSDVGESFKSDGVYFWKLK